MRESKFQSELISDIRRLLPGCVVMKNDPNYIQGIPDLIILLGKKWACLECKASKHSPHRPNQDYYVSKLNGMSYSAFVYPENKQEVLYEVQRALQP